MTYKAGERYNFMVMFTSPKGDYLNMKRTEGEEEDWQKASVTGKLKRGLSSLKDKVVAFICRDVTEKGPEFVLAPEYFADTGTDEKEFCAVAGPDVKLEGVEEGQTVEFKTSIIFSPETHQPDKEQPKTIAKEIAAFMNSKGGTLYLGVKDDGTVVGIERDFPVLGAAPIQERWKNDSGFSYKANRDGYAQKVRNLIVGFLGGSVAAQIPDLIWHEAGGRTYATLEVPPTGEDIVYFGKDELLVFRTGAQTEHLFGRQRDQYTKVRFHQGKVADFEAMMRQFQESLLARMRQSEGTMLELGENESVPLDEKHVAVVEPRGLVFRGKFQGETKSWSELYQKFLEVLAATDGEKFEALPDEDPKTFALRGGRVLFDRKADGRGRGRHLKKASGYLGPKGDVRADLSVCSRAAFTPPKGLVFRLIEHFGLKAEDFRIWTGPGGEGAIAGDK